MVPNLFVFSILFLFFFFFFFFLFIYLFFLHFHRLPCELENARVLDKIKRKFSFFFGEYQIYFIE